MKVDEEKNLGDANSHRETEQGVLRALDAEIAEKAMGYRWFHCVTKTGVERNQFFTAEQVDIWRSIGWTATEIPSPPPANEFNDDSDMPPYSTDIAAAMEVVEKMRSKGYHVTITVFMRLALCRISDWNDAVAEGEAEFSVPEAICRAALKATECLSISDRRNAEMCE